MTDNNELADDQYGPDNPVVEAIQELIRRIEAGEDLGSVEIDFDNLPPQDDDDEYTEWENAVRERAFSDD